MEANSKEHYRQGDVLVRRIDNVPDVKLNPKPDLIVLEGEISGHNHVIESGKLSLVAPGQESKFNADSPETTPYAIIELDKETNLVHPEHDAIKLPPGTYEVIRQRELTRQVVD